MRKYTVDLGNGNILTNLALNGTDFVSKEHINPNIFDGMNNVTVSDNEGGYKTYTHPELVHCDLFPDGNTYFYIRELSEAEIKANSLDAQVTYTAVMTDTLMEG